VNSPSPIRVSLSNNLVEACAAHARLFSSRIASHIHPDHEKRKAAHATDQLVAQLVNCATSLWLHGSAHPYHLTRCAINAAPHLGDGGGDLLATNLDCKGSLMRYGDDPLKYHLLVRPAEKHDYTVYLLGLVPKATVEQRQGDVILVGWLTGAELPVTPSTDPRFSGAHAVRGDALRALPPIVYDYYTPKVRNRMRTAS